MPGGQHNRRVVVLASSWNWRPVSDADGEAVVLFVANVPCVGEGAEREVEVSRIQRGRLTPAHEHFGSATSWTRTPDATPGRETPKGRQQNARNDWLTTEVSLSVSSSGGGLSGPTRRAGVEVLGLVGTAVTKHGAQNVDAAPQTRPERERRQPRYGRHPDLGPCPYQRSQTSDDTGDSTSEIIRTGAESHGGAAGLHPNLKARRR
jgi:hypothetical protein